MEKIAVFIAGDEKIINSSIVTFKSLKKYNDNLDFFLFVDEKKLTLEEKNLLKKNSILIPEFYVEYEFENELNWPPEIYWNFKAPNVLYELGYAYSLKVDNDILCIGKLDFEEILPEKHGFSGIDHEDKVGSLILKEKDFIVETLRLSEESLNQNYTNMGFVLFNNKEYFENNIWKKVIEYFDKLVKFGEIRRSDHFFSDQAVFGFILVNTPNFKWKKISYNYNFMVHFKKNVKRYFKFRKNGKIIHYTGIKPWKKMSFKFIRRNPIYVYFRQDWYKFIDKETNFSRDLRKEIDEKTFKCYLNDFFRYVLIYSPFYFMWILIWIIKNKFKNKL